MSFLFILTFFP